MEADAATSTGKPVADRRPSQKRPKFGKPRGPTCRWTPELDELLRTAWSRGGLRAARRAIRQQQPTWSRYSIKRRAAKLGLNGSRPRPWTETEINTLLLSIDGNASLSLVAKRLVRSVAAIRRKLWELGYKAESLGGFKVKELAEMLSLPPRRVHFWVHQKYLLTKGGRITERSLSAFLRDHHDKIPYEKLQPDMQSWVREMGYPAGDEKSRIVAVGQL
jgi:hypothetical protein